MKILIASTPATGHVNPMLAIARILMTDGHEVTAKALPRVSVTGTARPVTTYILESARRRQPSCACCSHGSALS
jgi:hypothetical protein